MESDPIACRDHNTSATYDYVIIGGGTAGLVLASRLTEDTTVSVVVLEAGENRLNDPRIDVPGFMNTLYGDENYDWNFKTTPQQGLNNRILAWPRGKVLGGSTAINFMMHTHASRIDLDNIERLGNPGWNSEILQPYYRKSETYNAPDNGIDNIPGASIIDPLLHGNEGPVQISFPKGSGPLDQAWGPTFSNLGIGAVADPRAGATLGGYSLPKSMDKNARRSYAAPAYYVPAADRPNLTVITNAHVNKINFASSQLPLKASAVSYSINGQELSVHARYEVLLCAGAVQSPQILELSGIGSKDLLEKHGIKVNYSNSRDHTLTALGYEVIDGVPTAEMIQQPGVLDWALQQWKDNGTGPLTTGVTGSGFVSYSSILPVDTRAQRVKEISKLLDQEAGKAEPNFTKQFQLQKEVLLDDTEADLQFNFGATGVNPSTGNDLAKLFTHTDPGGYAGIVVALTHPFSRGSIHIQSPNSKVYPLINPRSMSHPLDLELTASALAFTSKIASTKPLADLLKDSPDGSGKLIQPSFKVKGAISQETAVEIVKESTVTSFHPIGTCSMLPEAEGGVVDPRLRVYGTQNLRVVDASIIPLHVRGNICSLAYAIAERAADIIKDNRKGAD
ncbi:hypothetical protein F5884DRAFT_842953 [Xylogone sp. PMI_703]|nr:hypothetical protein F5884DRAFT_842953 [Xylogone sp. PMI_703]